MFRQGLTAEGRWFYRNRLRTCCLLTPNIRWWGKPILDGKERLTADSIKDKDIAGFGDLSYCIEFTTAACNGNQVRISREIMIPEIMTKCLEMPNTLSGPGIKAKDTIGEKIVPCAVAAIEIGRGRAGPDEHQPALFIQTRAAPIVGRAGVLPAVCLPGFMAKFSGPRYGMKPPKLFPGTDIECARISRGRTTSLRT